MERTPVTAVQVGPGGIKPATLRSLLASGPVPDLVVLPELCHLPYFPLEVDDKWTDKAIASHGRFIVELGSIAVERSCYIVAGLFLEENGVRFNAAVVLGPDGLIQKGRDALGGALSTSYRKVHLCDVNFYGVTFHEGAYFTPGETPVIWETAFGAVGVLICYDRHFPEAWRTLRAAGADIICVPTASPSATEKTFLPEMQAMALQQGVYAVVANRAGKETLGQSGRTTEYLGCSCIVGPDGSILGSAPRSRPNALISAECDPEALYRTRGGLPLDRHRRPDSYALDPVSTWT